MAAVRNNVQDFMAAVRSKSTATSNYGATLNSDNVTVSITKNGVVLFGKVLWPGTGSAAQTDVSGPGNQDTVDIFDGSGFYSAGSCQSFLNGLV